MGFRRAASLAVMALALQAVSPTVLPQLSQIAIAAPALDFDPIAATAVRDKTGKPVGAVAYATWEEAIQAGDMSAFFEMAADEDSKVADNLRVVSRMVQAIVEDDLDTAHAIVEEGRGSDQEAVIGFMDYLDAWVYALEGETDKAIDLHRSTSDLLPGLTAGLSLATLLEAVGREDQALLVYRSLMPGEIVAPKDQFDPQILVFSHVQTVVARRTLLLRKQGKIEEAVKVYQKLAESQPEQAVRYAAIIESLRSGWGIEEVELTPRTGLARALGDLSDAAALQKIITRQRANIFIREFDDEKSALDQLALLLVPDDDGSRQAVVGGLERYAHYSGAAHVALSGPEDSPELLLTATRSLLAQQEKKAAKLSLNRAAKLAGDDPEKEFGILSNAARQYMLLDDQKKTNKMTSRLIEIARNDAELASANQTKSVTLNHFGEFEEALEYAKIARELDDTHDRRVFLAQALAEAGFVDDAMKIYQIEQLKRPNDPYALNSLGYFTIEHTDDYANGYRALARADIMTGGRDSYIADSVGWALYKLGYVDRALKHIRRSRKDLEPLKHWEIEDHLGDLLWLQGDKEGAEEAWRTALTQYPPKKVKDKIDAKLAGDLEPKTYPRQPIPRLRSEDEGEITARDI